MKCKEAVELMTDLFDKESSPRTEAVRLHLADCPACHRRFEELQRAFEAVRPPRRVVASRQLLENTMEAIANEAAREHPHTGTSWHWKRWALAACAVAVICLLLPFLPFNGSGRKKGQAFTVFAQSIQAMSDVRTIHMTGRMRTLPGDNFELIGVKYDFQPIEIWREYTPNRWRIEKPGRVVVMDGSASTLYLSPSRQYMKGTPDTGFAIWLRPLLNPASILQSELNAANRGETDIQVSEANGTITLKVSRKAQGAFANMWAKNKSIMESDHTCIYTFDSLTKRLQGLQVIVHLGTQEVPVFELNEMRYDEALPDTLFTLQLPPDAMEIPTPAQMPAPDIRLDDAKATAQYFFDSLAREDWQAVSNVYPLTPAARAVMKKEYGGITVISIGEPFKSGVYAGYFVPYTIRLRNGENKSYKLAVRNDNPERRWVVDGGI
jgi:outer membrane lipoprotein-sorting protein